MHRRHFIEKCSKSMGAMMLSWPENKSIEVLNPACRVPVNFIIDDSTALVNMAHFGIPQFKEVFPGRYQQDWKKLPREIPDSFVLEFLEWCDMQGVKGKYSMVPFPACTGWLNRFIPGWSTAELRASLAIVRDRIQPNWDIHPEMISHTRVIDISTGLPFAEATQQYMENWEWSQEKSADELGEYIAYALQILKDVGFDCDGVTTPGGFAHRNIPNLAQGTQWAVQQVFGHGLAHFFRDVVTDPNKSVQPQVMHAKDLDSEHPSCSVHIIGCTGDWFGGWDGLTPGDPDRFITPDLQGGRLVEVIDKDEPAIMVCHWPGIYYNGDRLGFNIFKTVVQRLHEKYHHLQWMKLTDIARYWAARSHTKFLLIGNTLSMYAPFATSNFTIKINDNLINPRSFENGISFPFDKVDDASALSPHTWMKHQKTTILCFDLKQGASEIVFG